MLLLVLFTSSKKQLDSDLKIKLNWKRLYETDSVRYLGIQIDKGLTGREQIDLVIIKLNITNVILFKLKHALDKKISKVGLLCNTWIPFTLRFSCLGAKH